MTVDRVVQELALIGFGDMGTYLKLDGKGTTARLDWSDLPAGATKIIQEITQEEHTGGRGHEVGQVRRTRFKLYNKLEALDKLAKHLGMYVEKTEHTVNLKVTEVRDVIIDAREEAAALSELDVIIDAREKTEKARNSPEVELDKVAAPREDGPHQPDQGSALWSRHSWNQPCLSG